MTIYILLFLLLGILVAGAVIARNVRLAKLGYRDTWLSARRKKKQAETLPPKADAPVAPTIMFPRWRRGRSKLRPKT